MNTFSIVRDALKATENDTSKDGLDEATIEAGRVIAAVQTVVDALTPPTTGRWVVAFADIQTAGTYLGDHRIVVSSKPLRDRDLSLIEKAVVIATFAAHEIGHTYVSRPRKVPVNLIQAHNPHSGFQSVQNIADDIILEPFMVERYPILADAFEFTGLWVLRTTAESLPLRDTLNAGTSAAARFNILTHATRYGDIPQIEWNDENVRAERDWARDWKQRLLLVPISDTPAFLVLCDEFWDRVRLIDETPEPEPEPPTEGGDEPGTEDGGDEPGQPGGDEPGEEQGEDEGPGGSQPGEEPPQGNDFDEDTDEDGDEPGNGDDGDSEDGDGEDGDEPGGDTGSGDSEDGEDGDGDGDEPTDGDGDDEGDEPTDDDGDHDYTGHDGDGDPGPDADGGGGNAEADKDSGGDHRDEDEFDQSEVEKTTHDAAEQSDSDDEWNDAKVRTYASTTSTVFGVHGHLATTWD